ncbi:methyltransferase [uncultured Desulfobacter sp.]|uniref:methyltransferase n=1 Tax=uncultured Desulfobacter sp. TaxID=240139 RepID=UPI0029F5ACC3|nr:methyltransferase [uncultured Desulfobacter sp.]
MKKLPDLDTHIDVLYDIFNGRTKTQLLLTAIELKIFDYLTTPQSSEAVWAAYARSMANYERGGTAQKMAARVAQIDGFASFEKMLDLGGGPGLHCIAIVAENPGMKGVIFDRPAVVKVAEEFITEYEMEDRVTTMAGYYVNDPIGEGYDLIWASATLNFVRADLATMFKKIHGPETGRGICKSGRRHYP